MALFDIEPMTFYWRPIVTMALSHVVSDMFIVEKYRDLEIPNKVIESCTIRQTEYGFLLVVCSNFVPKTYFFWHIRLQKFRDLENRVRGPWMSLKMSPFDREPVTSYWRSIVTMALSRVVSEIFNVENIAILESRSRVNQGHWKWYHSIDCVWFPISVL